MLAQRFTAIAREVKPDLGAHDRLADLRTSRELDSLIADIHRLPGLDEFQGGPCAPQLQTAANGGLITILNHGVPCFHTLHARPSSITALRLDVEPAYLPGRPQPSSRSGLNA